MLISRDELYSRLTFAARDLLSRLVGNEIASVSGLDISNAVKLAGSELGRAPFRHRDAQPLLLEILSTDGILSELGGTRDDNGYLVFAVEDNYGRTLSCALDSEHTVRATVPEGGQFVQREATARVFFRVNDEEAFFCIPSTKPVPADPSLYLDQPAWGGDVEVEAQRLVDDKLDPSPSSDDAVRRTLNLGRDGRVCLRRVLTQTFGSLDRGSRLHATIQEGKLVIRNGSIPGAEPLLSTSEGRVFLPATLVSKVSNGKPTVDATALNGSVIVTGC